MRQIVMEEIDSDYQHLIVPTIGYADLFGEGEQYVFDGNRMTAHLRVGRNGVARWRLQSIKPDLSFVITPDLRIRLYMQSLVHLIRSFESVLDAVKPLDEAQLDCAQHGHAWSPFRFDSNGQQFSYEWRWCVLCGVEQVQFFDTADALMWPQDNAEIVRKTQGKLPAVHGVLASGGS